MHRMGPGFFLLGRVDGGEVDFLIFLLFPMCTHQAPKEFSSEFTKISESSQCVPKGVADNTTFLSHIL